MASSSLAPGWGRGGRPGSGERARISHDGREENSPSTAPGGTPLPRSHGPCGGPRGQASAPATNAGHRGLGRLDVGPSSGNGLSAHGTEWAAARGAPFPFCPWARRATSECGPLTRGSQPAHASPRSGRRAPAVPLPARLSQHLARSPAKTETGDSPGRAAFIACDLCP